MHVVQVPQSIWLTSVVRKGKEQEKEKEKKRRVDVGVIITLHICWIAFHGILYHISIFLL
jgi:hypothetical protein